MLVLPPKLTHDEAAACVHMLPPAKEPLQPNASMRAASVSVVGQVSVVHFAPATL
jgi:hypothetical protein